MAKRRFILFASETAPWRLAVVEPEGVRLGDAPVPSDAPLETSVAAARALLSEHGYAGEGLVLALPSAMCLAAPVRTDRLPRRQRREALVYRFEEHLPLPAEQLVCDFVERSDTALGVAVELDRLAPLVTTLEAAGVDVQHICATALLLLPGALTASNDATLDAVLSGSEEALDLLVLKDARPVRWHTMPSGARDLQIHLDRIALERERPLRLLACGIRAPVAEDLRQRSDVVLTDVNASPTELAARGGAMVLGGETAPPVDLRRDALAPAHPLRQVRRPLIAAAASVLLALLTVVGMVLNRGLEYERLAATLHSEQEAEFRRLLPGQPVPEAVLMRLASEERKLRGVRGAAGDVPHGPSALELLLATMSGLPPDLRFRLLELRLSGERVTLDGQARSHADADALAAALRRSGTLSVEPPRTEQLKDSGVSFTLQAAYRDEPVLARGDAR